MSIACFALILAPVWVQGPYRSLAGTFGGQVNGLAPRITLAALAVALVALTALQFFDRPRWQCAVGVSIFALGIAWVMGGGWALALALAPIGVTITFVAPWCIERLPPEMDGLLSNHRGWFLAWGILAIAVVLKSALLSTFMGDPAYPRYSLFPGATFLVHHSCLSGYVYAAERHLSGDPNIFDTSHMPAREVVWNPQFAPFQVDRFIYPPPFLLLPLALIRMVDGFFAQRAWWYGFNGIVVAAVLWLVACWVGGRRGAVALLLAPWVWLTWGYALQLGNIHGLIAVMTMAAMVAFDKQRRALGGGLLAAAALFKMAPGVLGVVLLVQRRWRDAALTTLFGIVFVVLGLVLLGSKPYEQWFHYLLPRLASGAAMDDLARDAQTIAANFGPFSIPFKLQLLGIRLDPWRVAGRVATVYTLLVFAFAIVAGRRNSGRGDESVVWLAVLTLALLQSPFAPPYYLSTMYWMIALVAGDIRTRAGAFTLAALALSTLVAGRFSPPAFMAALSLAAQCIVLGVVLWGILRASGRQWRPAPQTPLALT